MDIVLESTPHWFNWVRKVYEPTGAKTACIRTMKSSKALVYEVVPTHMYPGNIWTHWQTTGFMIHVVHHEAATR